MSQTTSPSAVEQLSDRLEAGTARLVRETAESEPSDSLSATATELWDVLEEVDDLLGTIDLERLPDAVDVSALPDLLELDELPAAIREGDPDLPLDLSTIRRVVDLRELWNTVDLVDFGKELRQLEAELEDVVGPDLLDSSGDSEAAAEIGAFVDDVKAEATNAALQQQAKAAAKTARKGVIGGHSKFETVYESAGRGTGYAGRRPVSNNPTVVSSVPYGPLPAGISTRASTVPWNVRGAKVDALPRIYGRRWRSGPPKR